jgi:adenylosuccinate synthase
MNVKVVTGANAGDEGKGMTAFSLAKEAISRNENVLSVLYNGGVQRGHTANGQVVHCTGTGDLVGGTTFYDEHFVVDPIALWLTGTKVFIHPMCRIVLPCDVMRNREKEISRGVNKHGSCGMGIFECVKRNRFSSLKLFAKDLNDYFTLYQLVEKSKKDFAYDLDDGLYNTDNFMRATDYVVQNCPIVEMHQIIRDYDTLIFEGGQGLLLDQANTGGFPYLTPSSVGSFNIHNTINNLGAESTEVFYVSRSYMTRHGVGPMDAECTKEDINPTIVDATNIRNDWQDELRFGYIDTDKLYKRVKADFSRYDNAKLNMVFTQLNYTDGRIATGKDTFDEIIIPDFVDGLYLSDQKDVINRMI